MSRKDLIGNSNAFKHGLARKGMRKPPELQMWYNVRARAKKQKVKFSIELSDIIIPIVCPVLGMILNGGNRKQHWDSPTLDRFVPSLGYVKGNISVISYRANLLKSNASIEELERVLIYMRSKQNAV